ncbi:hypothetical protein PR048_023558, partial [Dryococelus australis]
MQHWYSMSQVTRQGSDISLRRKVSAHRNAKTSSFPGSQDGKEATTMKLLAEKMKLRSCQNIKDEDIPSDLDSVDEDPEDSDGDPDYTDHHLQIVKVFQAPTQIHLMICLGHVLIFPYPDTLALFVVQTNLYAQQNYQKTGKVYIPTTAEEIKTFIGIDILMGVEPLPSYKDYWTTSNDLHDDYISQLTTVNRFGWLLTNLHLNDNRALPRPSDVNYDKLYKLQPFLSRVAENFQKNFDSSEIIAVDESTIKFKGRSSLKQYMPNKPIKCGYKVWVFEIYTEKKDDNVERQVGERVVKTLVRDMCGRNHRVYVDNYFNITSLFEDLKSKKIYACGTVNPTRKNLPTLKEDKNMKRGDYDWLQVPCPSALDDYNSNMNCIDKFDQMKGTYEIYPKNVVNAYILHKEMELPQVSLKNFRRDISRTLVSNAFVSSRAQKKRNPPFRRFGTPIRMLYKTKMCKCAKCLCVREKQNLASKTTTECKGLCCVIEHDETMHIQVM